VTKQLFTKKQIIESTQGINIDYTNSVFIDYEFTGTNNPYLVSLLRSGCLHTFYFEKYLFDFINQNSIKIKSAKYTTKSEFKKFLKNLKIKNNQFFISWSMVDCNITNSQFEKLPWLNLKSIAKTDVSKNYIELKKELIKADGVGKIRLNHKLEAYEKIYGISRKDKGKATFVTSKRKLDKIVTTQNVTLKDIKEFRNIFDSLARYNKNDVKSLYLISLKIQKSQ